MSKGAEAGPLGDGWAGGGVAPWHLAVEAQVHLSFHDGSGS